MYQTHYFYSNYIKLICFMEHIIALLVSTKILIKTKKIHSFYLTIAFNGSNNAIIIDLKMSVNQTRDNILILFKLYSSMACNESNNISIIDPNNNINHSISKKYNKGMFLNFFGLI